MGFAEELDERLRAIEAASLAFDAGGSADRDAARAAESLAAVFQSAAGGPSLLSRLGGTYAKVASTVPKPPYPQDRFAPLTEVVIELGSVGVSASTGQASGFPPPGFRPRLGSARGLRSVQAPDWWRVEPVFLVDHSKVTRRDVTLSVAEGSAAQAPNLAALLARAGWVGQWVSPFGEFTPQIPALAAASAAVRQIAHEVLNSPEILALAGRARKA